MDISAGTKLLHYEVVEKLGEGGMGVVWKARDTTLGRDVALKVLPDLFADDPERLARFEREARVLASLTHPGIAGIYGLHSVPAESGGLRFLAMEYVEGEDLDVWAGNRSADLEAVLGIGRQLCAALATAHDSGIIHRDLKPANIRISPDGQIKVLDFGLAKAMAPETASGAVDPGLSPTLTSAGTVMGMILGTAGYMSPEQARGRTADKRADVWAFGVVLYELLTGNRLFQGETVSDTLAAVLRQKPDWDTLPATTPQPLRRLLKRCLERDPERRLRDMSDAGIEIEEALAGVDEAADDIHTTVPQRSPAARLLPWIVAVVAAAAAIWFAMSGDNAEPVVATHRIETAILPPLAAAIDGAAGLALSPDGSQLVFVGLDAAGVSQLWLRSLDRSEARPLPGTEKGDEPFWSPDGKQIAFFATNVLKKLEFATGIVETLTDVDRSYGGAWTADGSILFVHSLAETLMRIPAGGGESVAVTVKEDDGDSHQWPSLLPDGRHFLYLVRRYGTEAAQGEIRVGAIDGGPGKPLLASNSNAVWVEPGYIVWWAGGNLRAQRFDADRLELVGDAFSVAADVAFDPRDGLAAFAVSANGILVYQRGGAISGNQMTWFDRDGTLAETVGPATSLYYPTLSPDGAYIAVDRSDETNRGDIWVFDAVRGTGTPLSNYPEDDSDPVWSTDGKQIAFFSMHGSDRSVIYVRDARGGAEPRLLVQDPEGDLLPLDWFEDLLLVGRESTGSDDLWVYSFADGTMQEFRAGEGDEYDGCFSPDGKWVAYTSDETGIPEIYVQRFAESGERWRVSTAGGTMPQWNPRGGELFYLSPNNELMSVAVSTDGTGFDFEAPRSLFRVDIADTETRQYDTIDGQRFLVNVNARPDSSTPLTVVQGWARDRR